MESDFVHTTLNIPKRLWLKVKYIAGEKDLNVNDLVVQTLEEKFGSIEVKV